MDQFLIYFNYFSAFFVIVPICFGIFNKVFSIIDIIPVFYLLALTLIVEIVNSLLAFNNLNNTAVFNIFTFFEFFFLVLFFKKFFGGKNKNWIHHVLIVLFLIMVIFTAFIADNPNLIDNFSVSIEAIVLITYSLYAFFHIMKNLVFENLLATPFFWINTGILIYFAGNLFLFAFTNYLQKHHANSGYLQLYVIHSILNILYYVILTIAFWKARKV